MGSFIRKIIKIIPGLLGLIQVLIPAIREVIIIVVRIIGIFRNELAVEDTVAKITSIFATIETGYTKFKNLFLFLKEG